ncbi:hypothetical protein [Microbulbifer sp. VAAF005]|uniref:hypothetical protein n=1 Tax=Microbulbifer sp. VAAF005 TaxID=3034230 RepID=UPI0024ADBC1B|nr:hypothetical protein [Microbulbifer sp. VAAF005]WHI46594.1 hypothetical protein P0078_23285 [Microbulbifer sp. VAAF005]
MDEEIRECLKAGRPVTFLNTSQANIQRAAHQLSKCTPEIARLAADISSAFKGISIAACGIKFT